MSTDKNIAVFDIVNQNYLGTVPLSKVDEKYTSWRSQGYGVLIDRDGDICLDNDDSEDDGLLYNEQLKTL